VKDDSPIRLPTKLYCIAFVNADGSFYIARKFYADNDELANEYAAEHFGDRDWYVLDARGSNINGGTA